MALTTTRPSRWAACARLRPDRPVTIRRSPRGVTPTTELEPPRVKERSRADGRRAPTLPYRVHRSLHPHPVGVSHVDLVKGHLSGATGGNKPAHRHPQKSDTRCWVDRQCQLAGDLSEDPGGGHRRRRSVGTGERGEVAEAHLD